VPTDTNLAEQYESFADLEAACRAFMATVNGRVHRTTKRVPADMLEQERFRLHSVPAAPCSVIGERLGRRTRGARVISVHWHSSVAETA